MVPIDDRRPEPPTVDGGDASVLPLPAEWDEDGAVGALGPDDRTDGVTWSDCGLGGDPRGPGEPIPADGSRPRHR